jgi:tRNA (adenine58-N1)-methyltransferase non-catalytic subunit
MSTGDSSDIVKEYDSIYLQFSDESSKIVEVTSNSSIHVHKCRFPGSVLIGKSYGSVFEISADFKSVTHIPNGELVPLLELNLGSGDDNRNIVDLKGASQVISNTDIKEMRSSGMLGSSIIASLAENSSTFAMKTVFSQEKWIKKKTVKYLVRFRVIRTNIVNVSGENSTKHPEKAGGLRVDSLALLLSSANLFSGCVPLICDDLGGLILSSVIQRVGARGHVVSVSAGSTPCPIGHIHKLNIDNHTEFKLLTYTLQELNQIALDGDPARFLETGGASAGANVESGGITMLDLTNDQISISEKRRMKKLTKKRKRNGLTGAETNDIEPEPPVSMNPHMIRPYKLQPHQKSAFLYATEGAHSCIIGTNRDPLPIFLHMQRFVRPSSPIVVFSQYLMPLVTMLKYLKTAELAVNLTLSEGWMREHQVLPMRTHPEMNMDGASGYLLRGMSIDNIYRVTKCRNILKN